MLETKTVTGTWLVEKTTHLYDLTIAPGAELKAPEGKFIAMTVDTLTEFPNIHDVVIRVEGKSPKFQMDMTRPFKRDESYIQMEKK